MLDIAVVAVLWLTCRRALEMEVTMVGLQNAGKTSLLRVLAVSLTLGRHRAPQLTLPREESSL